MEQQVQRHEKIRFRRDEITDLGALPSAGGVAQPTRRWTVVRRMAKACFWVAGSAAGLVCLLVAAVFVVQVSGIGSERLRVEAERAIKRAAGLDVAATVGPARLALGGPSLVALEVQDVRLARADNGVRLADAGVLRFGVELLPLLTGRVALSSATLSQARIDVADLPIEAGGDWTAALRNGQGLIDPDLAVEAAFSSLRRAFELIDRASTGEVALSEVDIMLGPDDLVRHIRIGTAALSRQEDGSLSISAQAELDGRAVTLDGTARRDAATGQIAALSLDADLAAVETELPSPVADASGPEPGHRIGRLNVGIAGSETSLTDAPHLDIAIGAGEVAVDLGNRGIVAGNIEFAGRLALGSGKLDMRRLRMTIGRSSYSFYGSIGPRPPTGLAGDEPAYRYDMISLDSVLAPEASPEPALKAYVRLTGTFMPGRQTLSADEIAVASSAGETLGSLSVRFVDGSSPGVTAAFSVQDMPVSHVKQLWPWFSARGARTWVLDKMFGGRVTEGRITYRVEPGRIGSGTPPTDDELQGRFAVTGTRFDTAGLMPPVRDAMGTVEFRGVDVDVDIASGSVYLPSGRTVAASNGTMAIRQTNRPPVIGKLEVDVAGDAPAIAELASYEPINAMRFVGIVPADLAGTVSGHVSADIPLQKGVDAKTLDWRVALDYRDLSIAKPLEGQMVTEAEGSIVVDPAKAEIVARARLNGIPAELDLIEPIRKEQVERRRIVTVALDDKTREKVLPGLSVLVSGPIKLRLDAATPNKQQVEADLGGAELRVPWAGWSKGPGIPARLAFELERAEGRTTLSNFDLAGKTFAAKGKVTLSGGTLAKADFSQMKLNRDDDVAVSIDRKGRGYAVKISGSALDARALVKQYMSDASTANAAAESGSVTVNLSVDALIGFHNERLSGVKLDYSGAGSKVTGLTVSAATKSGAPVNIKNDTTAQGRTLSMTSNDAGAVVRFLDIYENMHGGKINLSLKGGRDGPLRGRVDASNFAIVNEPRLGSIVATRPAGDSQSLNEAVNRNIDTSRVTFDRGATQIEKGPGYLKLSDGVLRGTQIGATFQGTLYDKAGNMDMTGTFMPAYGINRVFGEIPILGAFLGNGRDRGLIGVTFKLQGDADSPRVSINPLSVIAPGIFRSIFEYQ